VNLLDAQPHPLTVFAGLVRAGLMKFGEALDALMSAHVQRDPLPGPALLMRLEQHTMDTLVREIERPEMDGERRIRAVLRLRLACRSSGAELVAAALAAKTDSIPIGEVEAIISAEILVALAAMQGQCQHAR